MKKNDKRLYIVGVAIVIVLAIIAVIVSKNGKKPNNDTNKESSNVKEQTIDFNDLLNPAGKAEPESSNEQQTVTENKSTAAYIAAEVISKVAEIDKTETQEIKGSDVVDNLFSDLVASEGTSTETNKNTNEDNNKSENVQIQPTESAADINKEQTTYVTPETSANNNTGNTTASSNGNTATESNTNKNNQIENNTTGSNITQSSSASSGSSEEKTTTHPDPDGPGWSAWVK